MGQKVKCNVTNDMKRPMEQNAPIEEVVADEELTSMQRIFVVEYLVDINATQTARAGYSAKTAEQIGHQLLKKTSVQAAAQSALSKHKDSGFNWTGEPEKT
ncbi:terminase small subunit [Paenibacillus sp. NRS-1760]